MAVRPFYIEANIEGRATRLGGGPRRKDGYMNVELTQRSEGAIKTALTIECGTIEVDGEEVLCTSVYDNKGDLVYEYYSKY